MTRPSEIPVIISNMAWVKTSALPQGAQLSLQQALTVIPHVAGSFADDDSTRPLFLFDAETKPGWFGMARDYYLQRRKDHHVVRWDTVLNREALPSSLAFAGELRPDQRFALDDVLRALREDRSGKVYDDPADVPDPIRLGGLLQAPTGYGKSVWVCALIAALQVPTLIVVHRDHLMEQWRGELERFLPGVQIGQVQGQRADWQGKHVVLGMLQTLANMPDSPLLEWPGLVVGDECVEGSARIPTEKGLLPLQDVVDGAAEYVLSFGDNRWGYRRITHRWRRGCKATLLLTLASGATLRLTPEHLVNTPDGWMEARMVRTGTPIRSPVAVAAASASPRATCEDALASTCVGMRPRANDPWIGLPAPQRSTARPLCASAAVDSDWSSPPQRWKANAPPIGGGPITLADTIAALLLHLSLLICWGALRGRCWAMLACRIRTAAQRPQGSPSTTGTSKRSGHATRQRVWAAHSPVASPHAITWGMATASFALSPPHLRTSAPCALISTTRPRDSAAYPTKGWPYSPPKGWLGGLWTMARTRGDTSLCTPKATAAATWRSWQRGWRLAGGLKPWCAPHDVCVAIPSWSTSICAVGAPPQMCWHPSSAPLSSPLWRTSWDRVVDVQPGGAVPVFDLEVEGAHNFVANGLLVHNCHRLAARTWSTAIPRFRARWRIGVTATPTRKDRTEDVFLLHLGPHLHRAEIIQLLPTIERVATTLTVPKALSGNEGQAAKVMIANEPRNRIIVRAILRALAQGRTPLVMSKRRKHLATLASLFEDGWLVQCVREGGKIDEREDAVTLGALGPETPAKADARARLRLRHAIPETAMCVGGISPDDMERVKTSARVVFATAQFVAEAFNVPRLDTLILAMPMVDVEQAVGRILRRCEGKQAPLVIDIRDDSVGFAKGYGAKRDAVYASILERYAAL